MGTAARPAPALTVLVIPAIDLRGGRCVRLTQGRFDAETVYAADPVAVAREWVRQGARRLHLVDLDGARAGRPVHLETLAAVAAAVPVPVQAGGGVRSLEDAAAVLAAGAAQVVLGTRALADAVFLREAVAAFPGRVLVSVDVRAGRVAVSGWEETLDLTPAEAWARLAACGLQEVIVTDVSRDGTLAGPNVELARAAARQGFRVTVAGGVSSLADLERLRGVAAAVIVGRALYAGRFTLAEALAAAAGASGPGGGRAAGGV